MPEQPHEVESHGIEPKAASHGSEPARDGSLPAPHEDTADEAKRKARIEAAKRRYRATLRNEADSGGGGFSKEYYRSQKPPHWG
jgi:hypothetical protein